MMIDKIDCMNCQANYAGETGKKLGMGLREHGCAQEISVLDAYGQERPPICLL